MIAASPAMISVETVLQAGCAAGADDGGSPAGTAWAGTAQPSIVRQQHRIATGTTIRALLRQAGLDAAITRIEAGALGLSCHGRRAWLDDSLADGARVEMVEPIHADAKAARRQRVAADQARRRTRFGSAG